MIGAHAPHGTLMTRPAIYLDHNAASPLLPEARDALVSTLELTGNPSSVHGHGRALRNVIDTARGQVAACAGAERKQVVFTGSATEAITQAIVGGAKVFGSTAIISAGEHAAVTKAAEATGLPIITIGLLADGSIDTSKLQEILRHADGKFLVCLHWVNNETGVVQPIAAINALVGPTLTHCSSTPFRLSASSPRFCRFRARYDGYQWPQDWRAGRYRRPARQGPC